MNTDMLHNTWEHSIEEDTDNEMVFRPSTYAFPLRRGGRAAIDLKGDGTFTQRGDVLGEQSNLAADDRYNYAQGTWHLDESDRLSLKPGQSAGAVDLKVLSCSNDRLVISKQ